MLRRRKFETHRVKESQKYVFIIELALDGFCQLYLLCDAMVTIGPNERPHGLITAW